ncbi:MAG: putative lipid II flippase FtsW [Holosporales bacterium]|jgi:cell division protein FtsW|nr:putative lipid II flippase FtsW [Holosporales bacterium]
MDKFIRRDASVLGRWWWTVDHWLLWAVLMLVAIGIVLSVSASPCVATKIGASRYFFVKRHLLMVPLALGTMLCVSLLSPSNIRKLATIIFLIGILAMVCVLLWGQEIKGSKRWLSLFGVSIQPSEFVKSSLLVIVAWLLWERQMDAHFRGIRVATILIVTVAALNICQPDIGMAFVTIASATVQIFIAGMPLAWAIGSVFGVTTCCAFAYMFIPHVTQRIDSFFRPEIGDADQLYQVRQSLEAFHHGGWFGCGPGEGIIKRLVPDAHSDFVFSVAGEEYGIFLCIFIVLLFAFIVIRSLLAVINSQDIFAMFAVTGLSVQFGLQAFVNMSTAVKLAPTKGMTLPFISYGGSSMIAIGFSVGIILALTRRKHGFSGEASAYVK